MWAPAPRAPHTFMGDDDSLLFRADENSQSATSFPESATSLQSVVSHHVTHATHAVIGKEDSGGTSHSEHSLSSRLSSLPALCVPAPRDTHKIPQRWRFKPRRPRQGIHTHNKQRRQPTVQIQAPTPAYPHTQITNPVTTVQITTLAPRDHTHTEIKLDETLKRRKYFLGFKTRPKLG
jgi:hypothetical protein